MSQRPGWCILLYVFMGALLMTRTGLAQAEKFNEDESAVPPYTLPELLQCRDGTVVTQASDWPRRRAELLGLFAQHVYGHTPQSQVVVTFERLSRKDDALDGAAIREEHAIRITGGDRKVTIGVLLYRPRTAAGPVPAFVGLNFRGNHAAATETDILLNPNWFPNGNNDRSVDNKATEASRGLESHRWPFQSIVARGYAVATAYYGDIDPDFDDQFQNGIHPLFYREGQAQPDRDEWGSIGAWAWGLSRMLDLLAAHPAVDAQRVAVLGHSRLGKTALWAGAQDERFALVISNESGCGGAALNRRWFGETVKRINTAFPHWFCDRFCDYNGREEELPIDQHQLIALMAPRPVYVASAVEDRWADPRGEFLAAWHAQPVYKLLGLPGLQVDADTQPAVDQPLKTGTLGYHMRSGKHDVLPYDWEQFMDFADVHLRGK